jgi:hypothetical protein
MKPKNSEPKSIKPKSIKPKSIKLKKSKLKGVKYTKLNLTKIWRDKLSPLDNSIQQFLYQMGSISIYSLSLTTSPIQVEDLESYETGVLLGFHDWDEYYSGGQQHVWLYNRLITCYLPIEENFTQTTWHGHLAIPFLWDEPLLQEVNVKKYLKHLKGKSKNPSKSKSTSPTKALTTPDTTIFAPPLAA